MLTPELAARDREVTISEEIGKFVETLNFQQYPADVVQFMKLLILDSLGCMIGGFNSPSGVASRTAAQAWGLAQESTLIGTNRKVAVSAAIVANQVTLRYLDFNDTINIDIGSGVLVGSHPSALVPLAFAVGEFYKKGGRYILDALIAGYEVEHRVQESFKTSPEVTGFHHGTVHVFSGAVVVAKLLGLTTAQLVNAMGIAGSMSIGLDIVDATGEEYVMAKNVVDGCFAERAYVSCLLAKAGMTGPRRIFEGVKGFAEGFLGKADLFSWPAQKSAYSTLNTVIKNFCAEATTLGHIKATIALVKQHAIKPHDVDSVVIRTNRRTVEHLGDPIKKYPRSKENADHSSYFLTAMAIIDGAIEPATYTQANYANPDVHELIGRTSLVHDPDFDHMTPGANVTIRTKDGRSFSQTVRPSDIEGDPQNRMRPEAVVEKFRLCTRDLMSPVKADQVARLCEEFESLESILPILSALAVD